MSGFQERPWSDGPDSPKIPYAMYLNEKVSFAGNLVSSILYGIVIAVFFKCMAALFNPDHRRGEPIKWGLISYTVAMFSFATVGTATQFGVQTISYIDNSKFRTGPLGYQQVIYSEAIVVIQRVTFSLSVWLADGFLLYRCYVIYYTNLWVVTFPCFMYLASLAMGTMFIYVSTRLSRSAPSSLPYLSISLSLNILLTLMIVVRLILRARNTRAALGIGGIGGLCKAIATMLVESCALYAVSSLLYIGSLAANSTVSNFFSFILPQTQVIAPLLIILRVANKSALTKNTVASGRISEVKARTPQELAGSGGAPPGENPVSSVDECRVDSGEVVVGVQTTHINSCHDGIQGLRYLAISTVPFPALTGPFPPPPG